MKGTRGLDAIIVCGECKEVQHDADTGINDVNTAILYESQGIRDVVNNVCPKCIDRKSIGWYHNFIRTNNKNVIQDQ